MAAQIERAPFFSYIIAVSSSDFREVLREDLLKVDDAAEADDVIKRRDARWGKKKSMTVSAKGQAVVIILLFSESLH